MLVIPVARSVTRRAAILLAGWLPVRASSQTGGARRRSLALPRRAYLQKRCPAKAGLYASAKGFFPART